jgi:hypothetical protein
MTENAIEQDAQEGTGPLLGLLFYLAAASVLRGWALVARGRRVPCFRGPSVTSEYHRSNLGRESMRGSPKVGSAC